MFEPIPYIFGATVFYLISLAISHAIIKSAAREANYRTEMLLKLNAGLLAEMAVKQGIVRELIDMPFTVYNESMGEHSDRPVIYPTLANEIKQAKAIATKEAKRKAVIAQIGEIKSEIEKLQTGRNPHKKAAQVQELASKLESLQSQLQLDYVVENQGYSA